MIVDNKSTDIRFSGSEMKDMEQNNDYFDYERIGSVLKSKYDKREFDSLCEKIGIDSSIIKGITHIERVNNLINYCKEENITAQLVKRIRQERFGVL